MKVVVAATPEPSNSIDAGAKGRMKRLRIAGCVAFMIAAVGGCSSRPDVRPVITMGGQNIDLADPVEAGRAQLVTGQYGLAADALTRVTQARPGARALTLLAVAYDRLHRTDLADRYYAAALKADPHSVAALNNWGYSRLLRKQYDEAERLLRLADQARRHDPVIEANLRLLENGGRAAQATPAVAAPSPAVARIGKHVTAVKRIALVRMAPGVQLLVTRRPHPFVAAAGG